MAATTKPYMVIFKDDAPSSAIEKQIQDVKAQGGNVTRRFDSEALKGFAATLPESVAQNYSSLQASGSDDHFAFIEPDQEVHTLSS